MPRQRRGIRGDVGIAPYAPAEGVCAISCHSEPVLTLAWESVPRARRRGIPASLCEGGVKTEGFDGGRDMPRQRRGIRGDVGIAPYGMTTDSRA